MPEDKITKALKRINEGEVKVYIRGGEVCKIPAQEIKGLNKDGVKEVKIIDQDIE